jgi:hypothetical protein
MLTNTDGEPRKTGWQRIVSYFIVGSRKLWFLQELQLILSTSRNLSEVGIAQSPLRFARLAVFI